MISTIVTLFVGIFIGWRAPKALKAYQDTLKNPAFNRKVAVFWAVIAFFGIPFRVDVQ